MAEVLTQFAEPVAAPDGREFTAQACGARMADGLWEGWVEFVPLLGGTPIRSPRETTQPNRVDAEYWASGLTAVYLEGALNRALHPLVRRVAVPAAPMFEASAQDMARIALDRPAPEPGAVLNPFSVYEKSEALLRSELRALSAWHLVNIVRAYELSPEPLDALNRLSAASLIDVIVRGVRQQATPR